MHLLENFIDLKKIIKRQSLVLAQKEKFKNLAVYTAINKNFNNNRINAPKLISSHYENNMIEISDLGENLSLIA